MNILKIGQEEKSELIGIHANGILNRNIANKREINKRIDALCMDRDIAKKILGENLYEEIKEQLEVKKPFLNLEDKEAIRQLPEYGIFLQQYTLNQEKTESIQKQKQELEVHQARLESLDIPESIRNTKEKIASVKSILRECIDEKTERMEGEKKTFGDLLKKETVNEEKANTVYEFIFEHIENSAGKKKRKPGETSYEFYKRIDVDYTIQTIRKSIQEQEKKINEKISKLKEKTNKTTKTITQEKKQEKDYTKEALEVFCKNIDHYSSIKENFYLPEDKKDIEHIQNYFKKHLEETIASPNMQELIKNPSTPEATIEKKGDKISMNTNDYIELTRRTIEYKNRFIKGNRNPREYFFDRLVEYVGKDILDYKIRKHTKGKSIEHKIYKTDVLDDSFGGADYVVIFDPKNNERKRIAAIDLFISEKEMKETEKCQEASATATMKCLNGTQTENGLEEKIQKGEKLKIPYSTYIQLFGESDQKTYKMQKLKRFIEQQEPITIYTILKEMIKNRETDVTSFMESFEKKGKLYTMIEEQTHHNKYLENKINNQLNGNILFKLESIAA